MRMRLWNPWWSNTESDGIASRATWKIGQMSSASSVGQKWWIPNWSRDRGLRRKMRRSSNWWHDMVRRNGRWSPEIYAAASANSAARDGTTIWIQILRKQRGPKMRTRSSIRRTNNGVINGQKLQNSYQAEPIMQLKITGIQRCDANTNWVDLHENQKPV